eukprot:4158622-Amphidinium_carterae.1
MGSALELAFKDIVGNKQDSEPCNRPVGQRSRETINSYRQCAHAPQRLEPAPRECSLEAVFSDIK